MNTFRLELILDLLVFEKIYPLVKRCCGYAVKIIHLDQVVLGIDIADAVFTVQYLLTTIKFKDVVVVYAREACRSMIDIVRPVAKVKVKNIDRDNLDHGCVGITLLLMLGNNP